MQRVLNRSLRRLGLFSQLKTINPQTFPYKFGGVPLQSHNHIQQHLHKELFGNDVMHGFREAYLALLEALKEKNRDVLNGVLHPKLVQDLQWKDCQFVHDQSNIEVRIHKSFVGFNVSYERTETSKIQSKKVDQNSGLQLLLNADLFSLMQRPERSIPFLIGVEVYFKTAAKLITSGTPATQIDAEESHMIQFEVGRGLTMQDMISMTPSLQGNSPNQQQFIKIMKNIVGNNFQWRIGDVDKIWNRNLNL